MTIYIVMALYSLAHRWYEAHAAGTAAVSIGGEARPSTMECSLFDLADIKEACGSERSTWLWPYVVMAPYSYGPT